MNIQKKKKKKKKILASSLAHLISYSWKYYPFHLFFHSWHLKMLSHSRLILSRSRRQLFAVRQASQLKDSYEYVLAEVKGNVGVITVSVFRIYYDCSHHPVTASYPYFPSYSLVVVTKSSSTVPKH